MGGVTLDVSYHSSFSPSLYVCLSTPYVERDGTNYQSIERESKSDTWYIIHIYTYIYIYINIYIYKYMYKYIYIYVYILYVRICDTTSYQYNHSVCEDVQ